jgi:hypothetical protein
MNPSRRTMGCRRTASRDALSALAGLPLAATALATLRPALSVARLALHRGPTSNSPATFAGSCFKHALGVVVHYRLRSVQFSCNRTTLGPSVIGQNLDGDCRYHSRTQGVLAEVSQKCGGAIEVAQALQCKLAHIEIV